MFGSCPVKFGLVGYDMVALDWSELDWICLILRLEMIRD